MMTVLSFTGEANYGIDSRLIVEKSTQEARNSEMRSLWKVWVDAKTTSKAHRVVARVYRNLGGDVSNQCIEPYSKIGGFVVSFEMDHADSTWNDCVIEVIELGQRVGYGWVFAGDVRQDPSGWSNKSNVSGVTAIEWILIRPRLSDDVRP